MGPRKSGVAELVAGPSGKTWRVKLVEVGNDLYFTDGWEVFVKDNLVRDGDFMFFKFHGNSVFSVVVYDDSMCEKEMVHSQGSHDDVVEIEEEQTRVETVTIPSQSEGKLHK